MFSFDKNSQKHSATEYTILKGILRELEILSQNVPKFQDLSHLGEHYMQKVSNTVGL